MENTTRVNALLLPLVGMQVILPQSTVAEVTGTPEATPVSDVAPWLRGVFKWRAEQVALVSFETMAGAQGADRLTGGSRQRIAVLHGLEDIPGLMFYAIEIQSIPHPVDLERRMIVSNQAESTASAVVASNAVIGTQKVIVPDLQQIEHLIRDELQKL